MIAGVALLAGLMLGFVAGRLSVNADSSAPVAAAPLIKPIVQTQPSPAPAASESVAVTSSPVADGPKPALTNTLSTPVVASADISESPIETSARAVPAKPAETDWLGNRMQADLKRLKALKASHYAIQLMTADAREKPAMENYLRMVSKELNPDRIMVYPAGTDDNPRVSVLYGNYTERADANGEISRLPPKLLKFNPYARSLQAIRDDIRPGQ